ncbi:uncharacterized protein Tco025E_08095 [Trypanosoma conorhini]|uniref:Uncharacterized protein n=1 Tax=Trypanosoma conorhini TaxID=83891 RepID=A0A3R7LVI3_9TRYP|nr:uncharacterized protein Tco025E_08095 [Trypanosoma conorhini]RNF04088.1 hypothetical protein Tco025E_08095 [Trypanosoma conorhini]
MFVQQEALERVTAGARTRVSNLTREEELLLRGVRPGSEFAPLLYSALSPPHSRAEGVRPVHSAGVRGVAAAGYGSGYNLKGEEVSSGVMEKTQTISPPKNVGANLHHKNFAASPDVETGIGYSSQARRPGNMQGCAMPRTSPRVLVPSLMPMCDAAPPAPPQPLPHNVSLSGFRGGALPPLNTEASNDVDLAKVPLKGLTGSPRLQTPGQPKAFTSGSIPISDTKARLAELGDFNLPLSWPSHEDHAKHLAGRGRIGKKAPLAPLRTFGKSAAGITAKKAIPSSGKAQQSGRL